MQEYYNVTCTTAMESTYAGIQKLSPGYNCPPQRGKQLSGAKIQACLLGGARGQTKCGECAKKLI